MEGLSFSHPAWTVTHQMRNYPIPLRTSPEVLPTNGVQHPRTIALRHSARLPRQRTQRIRDGAPQTHSQFAVVVNRGDGLLKSRVASDSLPCVHVVFQVRRRTWTHATRDLDATQIL